MKAVLLARVSDRDQEAFGHSLPAQVERLRSYAERKGFEITEEFVYSETAGPKIRKKFEAMMGFLKRNKTVRVLLCMNVDRLTRNFRDQVDLDEMRRKDGLEIHFVQEGFVLNGNATGTELFMWEAKVFIAKQYINRLSDDAKRSIQHKLQRGECISLAPIGYINQRDEHGKGTVVLDSDRAVMIRRIFEEYGTGLRSLEELVKMSEEWGLRTRAGKRLNKSTIAGLLQNPFYCGDMVINRTVHPHKYPALITRELFAHCQDIRLGKTYKRVVTTQRQFIFRGLINCAVTGRVVTSDLKKGKYTYLVCADPERSGERMWISESIVLDQVQKAIDAIYVPEDVVKQVLDILRQSSHDQRVEHREVTGILKRQLTMVQGKIDRLMDLLLENSISAEEHREKRNILTQEREILKQQLEMRDNGDDTFRESLESILGVCHRASRIFDSSSDTLKREILNFVLSNLKLRGSTLCYEYRDWFKPFVGFGDRTAWRPKLDVIRTDPKIIHIISNSLIPEALRAA